MHVFGRVVTSQVINLKVPGHLPVLILATFATVYVPSLVYGTDQNNFGEELFGGFQPINTEIPQNDPEFSKLVPKKVTKNLYNNYMNPHIVQ